MTECDIIYATIFRINFQYHCRGGVSPPENKFNVKLGGVFMSLPQRKRNRLQNFDYSENRAYFITVCAHGKNQPLSRIELHNGLPVLKLTSDGRTVSGYVEKISEKYPTVRVEKYVVMPDHIHLLITLESEDDGTGNPSPTADRIMGWFKYQTTKEINANNNTAGRRFWQRSYYDHIIRNEADFEETYWYIELNPQRWIEKRNKHSKENEQCYIQAQETSP